jgi:hypothetical protein
MMLAEWLIEHIKPVVTEKSKDDSTTDVVLIAIREIVVQVLCVPRVGDDDVLHDQGMDSMTGTRARVVMVMVVVTVVKNDDDDYDDVAIKLMLLLLLMMIMILR